MSARAWGWRRSQAGLSIAGWLKWQRKGAKAWRIAMRPGYGRGMGANTLIHKGRKP